MVLLPLPAVALHVDQVPGWERQGVQIADDRAAGGAQRSSITVSHRQPRNRLDRELGAAGQPVEQLGEGNLALAHQHVLGAMVEVEVWMVAGVRATDYDGAPLGAGHLDHVAGGLLHARKAHLRQIVEVVLVDHREARSVAMYRLTPLLL